MAARKWESQEWKINIYIKIPYYGSQKIGNSRMEDQRLHYNTILWQPENGKVKNGRSTFTLKYHPMAARKWESQEAKISIYIKIPSYGSQKMEK